MRGFTWIRVKEQVIRSLLFLCALVSVLTTAGIILVLLGETFLFFRGVRLYEFFTETRWTPQYHDPHFGIWPLACGTFSVAGIAALIGLPIGLASALYMSEYASPRSRTILKPSLEILAGIPTVVFGYFALVFITPYLLRPCSRRDWGSTLISSMRPARGNRCGNHDHSHHLLIE